MLSPVWWNLTVEIMPIQMKDEKWNITVDEKADYLKAKVVAIWTDPGIEVKPWDIVILNKSNRYVRVEDEILVHFWAIFAKVN